MRIISLLWFSTLGVILSIISIFFPYYQGALGWNLPAEQYSLGYWPHLINSQPIPLFDNGSLAYRIILLLVVGNLIAIIGIVNGLTNRNLNSFLKQEHLIIMGGVITFIGGLIALLYGTNTYMLGWVQIYKEDIGVWIVIFGGMSTIIGASIEIPFQKYLTIRNLESSTKPRKIVQYYVKSLIPTLRRKIYQIQAPKVDKLLKSVLKQNITSLIRLLKLEEINVNSMSGLLEFCYRETTPFRRSLKRAMKKQIMASMKKSSSLMPSYKSSVNSQQTKFDLIDQMLTEFESNK